MKMLLGLEYDGSRFHGWQRQPQLRTIQTEVERALSVVANHPVEVICAGRTDAGVHAKEQVAHFDTSALRDPYAWVMGGNQHLPQDISVLWARPVPEDFHARYSACSRTYRYVILNRPVRSALEKDYVTWVHRPLDEKLIQEATQYLLGEHDFSSFQGPDCQSPTPIRDLQELRVKREGHYVLIDLRANAFLHNMVRNIVGVLVKIGWGDLPPEWAAEVLAAKDRCQAAKTFPPQGLYFMRVDYLENNRRLLLRQT